MNVRFLNQDYEGCSGAQVAQSEGQLLRGLVALLEVDLPDLDYIVAHWKKIKADSVAQTDVFGTS